MEVFEINREQLRRTGCEAVYSGIVLWSNCALNKDKDCRRSILFFIVDLLILNSTLLKARILGITITNLIVRLMLELKGF